MPDGMPALHREGRSDQKGRATARIGIASNAQGILSGEVYGSLVDSGAIIHAEGVGPRRSSTRCAGLNL